MKAKKLNMVDEMFMVNLQAYKNFQVRARKRSGRPVYGNFKKFYNYEQEIDRAMNDGKPKEDDRFAELKKFIVNQHRMKEDN